MKRPLSQEYIDSDSSVESDLDLEKRGKIKESNEKTADSIEKTMESPSKSPTKNTSEEVSFELSTKRRVTVRRFRQSVLVDIREFYEDKSSGAELPGKKGISLTAEQFSKLKELIPRIEAAIEEL